MAGGVFGMDRPFVGSTPLEVFIAGECAIEVISELVIDDNPSLILILAPADPDLGRGVIGNEWGVDVDTEIKNESINILGKRTIFLALDYSRTLGKNI